MVSHILTPHRIVEIVLTTLVITVLHQAGPGSADIERTCNYNSRPHRQGFCGHNLAQAIDALCSAFRHRLRNGKLRIKRSGQKDLMSDPLRAISLQPKDALSYLTKRGMTGTVICECCYHRCSAMELLQYCDVFGKKKRGVNGGLDWHGNVAEDSMSSGYY